MATVNVSEQDYDDIASAAHYARYRREATLAQRLDKLARKINAALSNQRVPPLTWKDVPSVFDQDVT
jgi:hypothetical protein